MRSMLSGAICAALCLFAATPRAAAQAEPEIPIEDRVQVVGEVRVLPELQELAGVKGWVVNGTEIPLEEMQRRAALYHGPYVLQDMIADLLLQQEAKRRSITLSDEEVEATVRSMREALGVRSEAAFESFLRTQKATPQWFRDKARSYALMRKVLADLIYVSDREVEMFFRRNQEMYRRNETVGFRAMRLPDRAAAEAARGELRKGRSFEEIAKAAAPSAEERAVAGDLQYYERGSQALPPEMEAALFAAPLNQVIGPIESMGSIFLIRVERKIDPRDFTLEEVREGIREQLSQQRLEDVVWPRWIHEQLGQASIETMKSE